MSRRLGLFKLFCLVGVVSVGCGKEVVSPLPEVSSQERLGEFFSEELRQCSKDTECVTGLCDTTPMFTISVSSGYCLSFPNAFERWQRLLLARKLAKWARDDANLTSLILQRVEEELGFAHRLPELEAIYLILASLATSEALLLLEVLHDDAEGPARQLAGLCLAEAGIVAGLDDVVVAAQSSVVRLRLHAARAAAGLCDETSRGVLAVLAEDRHPLVKDAAVRAAEICPPISRGEVDRVGPGSTE